MENTNRMRSNLTSVSIGAAIPQDRGNNHMKIKPYYTLQTFLHRPSGNKWRSFNNIEGQTGP